MSILQKIFALLANFIDVHYKNSKEKRTLCKLKYVKYYSKDYFLTSFLARIV